MLRATVELLDEIGYARLTIPPLVAARAGATPPAVYRRFFPTKVELVYEAVFPTPPEADLPLTGDVDTAIRGLLVASIELFASPAVHTAMSGLMAELPAEPGLSARLLGRLQGSTYVQLQRFLDEALPRGGVLLPVSMPASFSTRSVAP